MPKYDKKLAQEIARKLPDKTLFNRVLNDEHAGITTDCLVQTGYVVDYLYDNQIPFRIEQTTSGGYLQLQAVTDSPKARITLTGKDNHVDFIGSGIKANQRYAFTSTPYSATGNKTTGTSDIGKTYRPGRDDMYKLLDAYMKNDMTAFASPSESHTLSFNNGNTRSIPNVYYQNGKLRKSYRTFENEESGEKQDVELLVQPIRSNVDGEARTLSNSVRTLSAAISDSRDYLVEELMNAADYMSGKVSFGAGQKLMTPSDYGIDDADISDMATDIRNLCANAESEYSVELAESTDKYTALKAIVTDYVNTQVLGLSKNPNGELLTLPDVDINDYDFEATESDIPVGFTVDPTAVSSWTALSENENNVFSRQRIQSAMRGMGLTKDNIVGDDNRNATMADALVSFNEAEAKTKDDFEPGSFERRILEHTEDYLRNLGIQAECRFDDNGIIDVSGQATGITNGHDVSIPVHAQIGQIFAPDEHNVVHVIRNRNENFLFVPGYKAFIEEDDGSGKNLMERTVLTGYFQSACSSIDDALSPLVNSASRALNSRTPASVDIALPTTCNSVYGEAYGTRLAENHMEIMLSGGFDENDVYAIYAALSGKIAYSREMDKEATTINSIGGESQRTRALEIAGQNLREMGDECIGYVYTNMTNTGRGSGTRRYLCSTAKVAEDGHIIKGDENDTTSPLFQTQMFAGVNNNALDRVVMAFSQITTAQGIDKNAKVAHVIIDGWTLDDGYVVSKDFAERNMVPSAENGEKRPLGIGDKISDMNGNKGVINMIIDPDMPEDEAKSKDIWPLVQTFRLNRDLDCVGAPYSGMSRSNAGTAVLMMENSSELHLPNGVTIEGGIGTLPMLITSMTVDTKTHIYDEDDEHQRNSSGQLSWMLSSQELGAISREIYGDNETGLNELRAYLNIIGATLDEKGNLHLGFGADSSTLNRAQLVTDMSQDNGSGLIKVKAFDEYVLDTNAKNPANRYKLQRKNSAAKWDAEAKDFNGLMQLPFPVQGADGKDLEVTIKDASGKDKIISVMPVVSAAYRSDIKHDNGETYSHDYTKNYASVIKAAGEYMSAATRLSKLIAKNAAEQKRLPDGMTIDNLEKALIDIYTSRTIVKENGDKKFKTLEGFDNTLTVNGQTGNFKQYVNAIMSAAPASDKKEYNSLRKEQELAKVAGQSEYNNIVNDTITKKFEDRKHGAIANCVVKVGCKHSATAVWTADKRLPLDTIAMSREMYDRLKIQDGYALIWRDPLLRDAGLRYMKVAIDDDLTGISVNPLIAKGFDGDFDGDSLGITALQTPEAQHEAKEKLTVQVNILDKGNGEKGNRPFMLQDGMDFQAGLYASPKLADKWTELNKQANYEDVNLGGISSATFKEISDTCSEILEASSYQNFIDYSTPETITKSLMNMSKEFGNGAKGSIKKMKGFMEYMGYDVDIDDKGNILSVTDSPMDDKTRFEHNRNVCIALGCKCDETGVAGYASQKAIRALRDICPTEALELTYPVTQGMLQAKHDAAEAQLKANLTQNVIPDLWEGKRLLQDDNNNWNIEHSSDKGRTISLQATPDEWKDQFMRIMCQANGIDVPKDATPQETRATFATIMSPDALDTVAEALTDENGTIMGVTELASRQSSIIDNMMYGVAAPSEKAGQKVTITEYIMTKAKEDANLFDHGAEIFAPNSVRIANGMSISTQPVAHNPIEPLYINELQQNENSYSIA